jgi:hypothetical protein
MLMEDTPMAKIHFLFLMLGITAMFVTERGILKGIITKNEFVQKKKVD